LTFIALSGSAEAHDYRGEAAVLSGSARKRGIAAGKINEMIEIGASKAERPLALHIQKGAVQ
jgi:hypothetical protein